jgi:spermidine synthase
VTRKTSIGFSFVLTIATLLCSTASAEEARDVFDRESSYNHVVVTEEGHERVLHFRRRSVNYRETVIDTRNPLRLVNEYTRLMMSGLMFVPRPRQVLMIGLGGGIVTRVMSNYYPSCTFDNVELDPVVVEAARRYFHFETGPQMRVHLRDGRVFLRRSRDRYDIIILDAFRGGYVPFHLKTREFLEMVAERLAPGGIVIANLHNGTSLYDSDRATFDAVFDQTYAFVGREDANVILIAQRGGQRMTVEQLREHAIQLQREHRFSFDLPDQLRFYNENAAYNHSARVLTDDHAPVESLEAQER